MRARHALAAGIGLMLVLGIPVSAAPAAAEPACSAPGGLARFRVPLPHTARAIQKRQPVTIVAIGSSSTAGVGATEPGRSYPARLAVELTRRLPGLAVTVHNKGVNGETASEMLARFPVDVMPYRPQLVIWQTGSNTALRGGGLDAFEGAVRDGVKRLKLAGIDLVLMDPQFAPRLVARPLHRQVVDVIGAVARDTRVAVFRRYEAMRHWIDHRVLRPEDLVGRDQLHMTDLGYACIARLLADSLVAAATTELQSPGPSPIQSGAPR